MDQPPSLRPYTAQDWIDRKDEIAKVYEDGTLDNVMEYMEKRHGLQANKRQYDRRFDMWGLKKHMQSKEAEFMIKKQEQRMRDENKETEFRLRERLVEQRKIDRYKKRKAKIAEDEDVNMDGGTENTQPAATPPEITYYTPANTGPLSPEHVPVAQLVKEQSSLITENFRAVDFETEISGDSTNRGILDDGQTPLGYRGYHGNGYPGYPGLSYGQYPYRQPPPPQQFGGYGGIPASQPQYGGPSIPTVNSNAYVNANSQAALPPQGSIQFGNGTPQGYAFQYSNCSGRRKALLIGINYFGERGQLRGCINDVKNMSTYLNESFGYKREDMIILTDDQQNPMSQPTKQNILRAMHWLVKDARPNDSLFFHYSGHGGQTKDLDGDEDDGYDEVIYPVDFRQVGHIVDDDMHNIMVKPLQPGVRLTAIFDSCHSGTALDLPYIYSTQGILKEPNLAKEAGAGLLGVISNYAQGDTTGVASKVMGFFKKATTGDDAYNRTVATKTSPADVIMWSGSKDDQTSADATIAAQATGAVSWAFINALKKNPQQSYVQLLNSIRDELATKYTQKPQLSCSHPLNTNLLFVM